LLVEVLSKAEDAASNGVGFYDQLCDAVCQLVRMRRALIFRYDAGVRRVRAAGAHGLNLDQFASAYVTVESAPIAAESLREDRVIEIDGDMTGQFPEEYASVFPEPVRLVCAPMAAGGRNLGVIFADRLMSEPPLDDSERHLLWMLGKAAALASVARFVATESEKAHQLEQRIDLAREIHEGVIQRLFGISMALDGDGDLPAEARQRCAAEAQEALSDLRSALQRPLGRAPRATETTFVAEVERLARVHPDLSVTLESGGEHAHPTRVAVRVGRSGGAFVMEVANDGVSGRRRRAGMGLRLAAMEALQSGGVIEFGEREPGTWQVRLVVPDDL